MKPLTENSVLETRGLPDPRSRTSAKKERVESERALTELASALLELSVDRLHDLGVPERAIDALLDASKIKSHAARARQMRQARARLRDADWAALRARLDQFRAGLPLAEEPSDAASRLVEQLLIQGDSALSRVLESYPNTDRNQLRTLIRNHQKATPGKRARTRDALLRAVRTMVAAGETEEHPNGPGGTES